MMTTEQIRVLPKTERFAYYELLAHLLIIDFQVTEQEQRLLTEVGSILGLSDQEQQHALKQVNIDDEIQPRVQRLQTTDKAVILAALHNASMADGRMQAREQGLIDKIHEAFEAKG
ncbi:MAG TPA: hypothetical protein DCQ06_08455 [Myxococcales bacterium]|nr:hypothetical protein [Myxococcales bacterium]|tara:strand:- start:150 stop:497 length:348 start_codon:yes stop_codon:yes gene_type:complete